MRISQVPIPRTSLRQSLQHERRVTLRLEHCKSCDGLGWYYKINLVDSLKGVRVRKESFNCDECDGNGYTWQKQKQPAHF